MMMRRLDEPTPQAMARRDAGFRTEIVPDCYLAGVSVPSGRSERPFLFSRGRPSTDPNAQLSAFITIVTV